MTDNQTRAREIAEEFCEKLPEYKCPQDIEWLANELDNIVDAAVREKRERCINRACEAACRGMPIYESNVLSRQIAQAIRSTDGVGTGEQARISGCEICGHLSCVCRIKGQHQPYCKFRIAATCAVGIECDHGHDVCPICNPCTCDNRPNTHE